MAQLTPFDQGSLLIGVTDPVLRGGICVALCDYWLALFQQNNLTTAQDRMAALRAHAPMAMAYQKTYAQQRATQGREAARAQLGRGLGHQFEGQTTVTRLLVGMAGIRDRMSRDLGSMDAAVTWTMSVPGLGRHAIAGRRRLVSVSSNFHKASLHIFDPNIGEYVGELHELDGILRDLFQRIPDYARITELDRTTAS